LIDALIAKGIIEWIVKSLERSRVRKDINLFSLEYSCTLLANLEATDSAKAYL
jgi:hypothetical protein